nr:hypothetical protein [uncultured Allomuricauda sp.]
MRYGFLFLILIGFFAKSTQPKVCEKFRTGSFKHIGVDGINTLIERNDTIQIETNPDKGSKLIASINWLSDCQYRLTYIDVNVPDYKFLIGTSFNVDIVPISKNTYKYTAYDDSYKIEGEILKIN